MSHLRYFILLILLVSYTKSTAQNDCVDAIVVCGNTGFEDLNATGFGVQELSGTNACNSDENNSIWLKVAIDQGGTLGFTLTPASPSIVVDFDFFIFGPNVSCGNIGQAIRCSTTNPQASGAIDNTTGLNETETDIAEGPGPDGNNFVQWLTVSDNDTYFLVIDRPIGSSNFSLTWTGTATFKDSPVFEIPTGVAIDIEECDSDDVDDGITVFNLEQNTPIAMGTQLEVAVTYYLNSSDVFTGLNPIPNPTSFTNTTNPQIIYTRITDTNSGCFNTTEFTISVINTFAIEGSSFELCDDNSDGNDANGLTSFNFNTVTSAIMGNQDLANLTIKYYATNANAVSGNNPLPTNFTNTTPNEQIVFVKVTNTEGCSKIKEIKLKVNPLPTVVSANLVQCDPGFNPDGITLFNLAEANAELTNGDTNLSVEFFFNGNLISSNYTNISNPQVIQAVVTDNNTSCSSISTVNLSVNLVNPIVTIPPVCDDEASEDGFAPFNLDSSDLVLTATQTVSYYETLENALLEENEILNPNAYVNLTEYNSTIYFRIEEENSCNGIGTIDLKVNRLPNLLKTVEKEIFVCQNLPLKYVTIDAKLIEGNPADFIYEWFKDNVAIAKTTYSIQVNQPGLYKVIVTNAAGCTKTREILVHNSSEAIIEDVIVTDATTGPNSITIVLSSSSIGNYEFALDYENGIYQMSNVFENVTMGFHTIYIRDLNGCGTVQEIIAVVGAPKYFTPNGDGYNDLWKIAGVSQYFSPSTVTYIYDRYGKFIHKVFALDDGWDGTYNGNPLPSDDYWYEIKLEDGRTVKGHFSLKR